MSLDFYFLTGQFLAFQLQTETKVMLQIVFEKENNKKFISK